VASNRLAAISGEVEFYDAALRSDTVTGQGLHAVGMAPRDLPSGLRQWRVSVRARAKGASSNDIFLLNCTGGDGCTIAAHAATKERATLVVDDPKEGAWRIVMRCRKQGCQTQYNVREALLVPKLHAATARHASGTTWEIPVPASDADGQYVAFQINGETSGQGLDGRSNPTGLKLSVAVTPLSSGLP
jgi:hypothetical protein